MRPTPSDVHVNRPLTNISIAYVQDSISEYASMTVFPTIPVQKQSDVYWEWPKEAWFVGGAEKRAPNTKSRGRNVPLRTASYRADVYALHDGIPDQVRANADEGINLDEVASRFLQQSMLITKEQDWANTYFKSGVWANNEAAGTDFAAWDNFSLSDPQDDIERARVGMKKTTGIMPNTLVVSLQVHKSLKLHPLLRDQVKYTSADSLTPALIARLLEVERYVILGAVVNDVADDQEASDFKFIAGNHAAMFYVPSAPSLMTPSAGYSFAWTGYLGAADGAGQISRWYNQDTKSTIVEIEQTWDHKQVAADMGWFFENAVTAV